MSRKLLAGACWAFIANRINILTYGFYPDESQMARRLVVRPADRGAGAGAVRQRARCANSGLIYAVAYPFIAGWLLLGGLGLDARWHRRIRRHDAEHRRRRHRDRVLASSWALLLALGRQSHLPIVRIGLYLLHRIHPRRAVDHAAVRSIHHAQLLPAAGHDVRPAVTGADHGDAVLASGYIAEVVRGGLQSIPNGQYEAANSMGLKYWQSMRLVILPQALKSLDPRYRQHFHRSVQGHHSGAHHRPIGRARHRSIVARGCKMEWPL